MILRRIIDNARSLLKRMGSGSHHDSDDKSHDEALWSIGNPFERRLEEAVAFALRVVDLHLGFLPEGRASVRGRTILEVGPGQDFGAILVFMGLGARGVIVDRFACAWDKTFHPEYYESLRAAARSHFADFDDGPIRKVLANGDHLAEGLSVHRVGLEDVDMPAGSIDISISNATLEHLADPAAAFRRLGHLTRPGGFGYHQVDFRDHRDFDHPLEFLAIPDEEFAELIAQNLCSCGNRLRAHETSAMLESAGFETRLEVNMTTDPAYLEDIGRRALPRFREMPVESMAVLGGRFHLKKRPG